MYAMKNVEFVLKIKNKQTKPKKERDKSKKQ